MWLLKNDFKINYFSLKNLLLIELSLRCINLEQLEYKKEADLNEQLPFKIQAALR